MSTIAAHTTWMTGRQLRTIARMPAYLVISLVQPVIWLFLFGSLFRKVVELPGFGAPSYLDYLVPGVVIMSALSTSMWSGMIVLEEIDRGSMNRFLLLPLTFLSTAFMAKSLMPHWMRIVAACNPVNWALEAGRAAMSADPDWARVAVQGGGLALLALAVTALSVLTIRTYSRSV